MWNHLTKAQTSPVTMKLMQASENSAAEGRDEYAIMFLSIEMCCNLLKKDSNTRTILRKFQIDETDPGHRSRGLP